ncbi:peptidylprolyl isomerase [Nannochloropsis oceanica]
MARPPYLGLLPALAALRLFMSVYIVAVLTFASSRDAIGYPSSSSTTSSTQSFPSVPSDLRTSDAWGPISTPVPPEAITLFNEAVRSYAGLRGQVLEPLLELTTSTPFSLSLNSSSSYLMAHIYRGSILLLSTGVLKNSPLVRESYHAAAAFFMDLPPSHHLSHEQQLRHQQHQQQQQEYPYSSPTARERWYYLAFHALYYPPTPDFALAAMYWEEVLAMNPRELLAVRSVHDAYIILGDSEGMKRSLARVLSRWDLGEERVNGREEALEDEKRSEPQKEKEEKEKEAKVENDYRMVRSMWAFALEETGDLNRAALVARQVLSEDATDVTALHALIHTYEMTGRREEGEKIYKEFKGKWEDLPSLFTNHVAWHRAVLALGREEGIVWEVLDGVLLKEGGKEGGTVAPATPLALADAASLLWRMMLMEDEGEEEGERGGGKERGRERRKWEELRTWYGDGGYETMHTTSFNDVHMMMCLSVTDIPAAKASLSSMKRHAAASLTQQQQQLKQQLRELRQQHVQQEQWPRWWEVVYGIGQLVRVLKIPTLSDWLQRTFREEEREGGREGGKKRQARHFSSSSSSGLPFLLPQPTNSYVLSEVGLDISEALIHYVQGNYSQTVKLLSSSSSRWHLIGGSHAQRDVLKLTLISACLKMDTDLNLGRRLLAERAMEKDEWNEEGVWTLLRRVAERRRRRSGREREDDTEELGRREVWLETAEL